MRTLCEKCVEKLEKEHFSKLQNRPRIRSLFEFVKYKYL